ncbi:hypothetical protein ACLD02_15040 [Alloalcanivorax sp. C16-2]|uniref:hypothetical protein n=1 Tax=Alloalcanivorax TaxID=3020832 RepID=UPI0019331120|nr:hypothetical protein [Alloalcanivorax marinus]MBL7248926.1 hypothetical protein [Alloalcanivorax marinus]
MSFSVAPFLILAVSLVLILVGAWVLLRHKWVWQWIKGTAGLALVALAVYLVLVALNLYSFHELNEEVPVATVSFRATGDQSYIATVTRDDGSSEDFRLNGDQWQLDARIVKWKMPFTLLGLKPGYQLDRIQGRYFALEDERSKERTVYSLSKTPLGMDVWSHAREGWSFLVDARYGSAAYLPMADGAIFEVTVPPAGGLIGRPLNGSAQRAVAGWQ